MTRYFAQNTPRAGLEHMMMSVPGFQKRGGGMMILSRFCYKPEDVDCRYCLHYRRRSCQVRTCPYIAERLKSGAIEYLDLILEYFGHIPHAGLHKRIQAVEHWSGPDQAVLHTVSVHLRSRFADRVWDDAPPGYLAALYLLASKERLWQPALSALSHDSIDFSRIVSKPHGFAIQDYMTANVGTVFSASSLAKFFKNEQRTVAAETILNYVRYCCDAYLFYQVKRQDLQGKQILASNEKYYIADHGIREAVFGGNMKDINLILENIVYMELLRRGYVVTVGRAGEKEIDFVCEKRGEKLYVQVTYLLASEDTVKREFGAYDGIQDNFPKYVVSLDEFDMSRNGIKHRNIRDFLLAEEWN